MIKEKKGFTLMEVIVAIALMGIIAVGIIPAFGAQFKMTMDSREITTTGFDAQGFMEDDIHKTQELLRENGAFSGDIPKSPQSIFGRNVSLYRISRGFPLNENKNFIVFLSEKLAEMSFRNPLIASLVRIDGEENNGTVKEGIEVASIRGSSTLKLVKGIYQIEDYVSSQDLNLYRWYRSIEGFSDPKFPEDYEFVEEWRNKKTIAKADLQKHAANRYLMLSLVPVDKSGVRGAEKPSANRVYVQGEEWRSGILAWVDKNADGSYDTSNDVSVMYGVSRPSWVLLNGFESGVSFPSPENPNKKIDPSDGSLYVPMGVERARNSDRVGKITLGSSDSGKLIRWNVDKSIHLANEISTANHTDIEMNTVDGGIMLYQYVDINTTNGEALYGTDGKAKLVNNGAKLNSDENIILRAGEQWGSISLEPYTSIVASKDIMLAAAEKIIIKGSSLTAGGTITVQPQKRDFSIEDTAISAQKLTLGTGGAIRGGSWSAGTKVVVSDGETLIAGKGKTVINNDGMLQLGSTGGIAFESSMDSDLKNPLVISLEKKSSSQVEISTNYGRNVAYAGSSMDETIDSPGYYQDLGSGRTNLRYTVEKELGKGNPDLFFSFDGAGTISIDAEGSGPMKAYYKLSVKDKFAEDVVGTITFRVTAAEDDNSPTVQVIGNSIPEFKVTFYRATGNPNNYIQYGSPISVKDGETVGEDMPANPSLDGYYFTGWLTESGAPFTKDIEITEDVKVYAQYSFIPKVTVTFYKSTSYNDSTVVKTVEVPIGGSVGSAFPGNPTWTGSGRANYQFLGWCTSKGWDGSAFTNSTPVTQNINVYAQWGKPLANIEVAEYVSIDGIDFQKITNAGTNIRLLVRSPINNGLTTDWSTASNSASSFAESLGKSWATSSGLLSGSDINGQNQANVRNIGVAWWGDTSIGNNAYYVDASGGRGTIGKTSRSYGCRPYISFTNQSRLYGIYVWTVNGTPAPGTAGNPYLMYYQ